MDDEFLKELWKTKNEDNAYNAQAQVILRLNEKILELEDKIKEIKKELSAAYQQISVLEKDKFESYDDAYHVIKQKIKGEIEEIEMEMNGTLNQLEGVIIDIIRKHYKPIKE